MSVSLRRISNFVISEQTHDRLKLWEVCRRKYMALYRSLTPRYSQKVWKKAEAAFRVTKPSGLTPGYERRHRHEGATHTEGCPVNERMGTPRGVCLGTTSSDSSKR